MVAHHIDIVEVAGSSPVSPTIFEESIELSFLLDENHKTKFCRDSSASEQSAKTWLRNNRRLCSNQSKARLMRTGKDNPTSSDFLRAILIALF